jgi:hypothetical protein
MDIDVRIYCMRYEVANLLLLLWCCETTTTSNLFVVSFVILIHPIILVTSELKHLNNKKNSKDYGSSVITTYGELLAYFLKWMMQLWKGLLIEDGVIKDIKRSVI